MEIELLPDALIASIKKYTDEKVKKVDKAVKEYTEKAEPEIVEDSPVGKAPRSGVRKTRSGAVKPDNHQPGSYKKGWITVVKKYENRTQGINYEFSVCCISVHRYYILFCLKYLVTISPDK